MNEIINLRECELCGELEAVEEKIITEKVNIKGEEIEFPKKVYYCRNIGEFFSDLEDDKADLIVARDIYRKKHGLLTSKEIKDIRKRFGLSQKYLGKILGLGDATIQRYETQTIQDAQYDAILRKFSEDPTFAFEKLKENEKMIPSKDRSKVVNSITRFLNSSGNEFLVSKQLEYLYAKKGYLNKSINLTAVNCILSKITKYKNGIDRVTLQNLLYLVDVFNYEKKGETLSGLVYQKEKTSGVKPIGFDILLTLDTVVVEDTVIDNLIQTSIKSNAWVDAWANALYGELLRDIENSLLNNCDDLSKLIDEVSKSKYYKNANRFIEIY